MKKLVGVLNMKTGEIIAAPTHCPFCGQQLGEMIRQLLGTSFEITCDRETAESQPCGKTCIVMNDHQVMR